LSAVFTVPQTYGNTHGETQLKMIKHTVDGTNPAPPKGWLEAQLKMIKHTVDGTNPAPPKGWLKPYK